MSFDKDFYLKWKTRTTSNRQLLFDNSEISKIESDKIFSSTALNEKTDSEEFSLRLSESYVDETQESTESKEKKCEKEIIVISDSSSNSSVSSYVDPSQPKCNRDKLPAGKGIRIIESSEDESYKTPVAVKNIKKPNFLVKSLQKQDSAKKVVIEESDSDAESSEMQQILKETVNDSGLSEKKKKEILHWLQSNFDNMNCGSSYSQDSVCDSRRSGISSGNSSLERLEQNYETPNNRGKLSKQETIKKSSTNVGKDYERKSRLDRFSNSSKKGQLNVIRDRTPGSKSSDKTPMNSVKSNRKKIIPETQSTDSKVVENSEEILINNIQEKNKIVIIPESESFASKESEDIFEKSTDDNHNESNDIPIKLNEKNSKDKCLKNRQLQKDLKIPDAFEITDDIDDCTDMFKKLCNNETNKNTNLYKNIDTENYKDKINIEKKVAEKLTIAPTLEITDDILESSNNTTDKNLKNQKQTIGQNIDNNTTINTTINDCVDILENLYGEDWKHKAQTIIPVTEPKKRTKPVFRNVQTEKRPTFKKPQFDLESDEETSNKENERRTQKKGSQTTSKKINRKPKDNFINDDSTTESSPDCSYYTAVSNPLPSQNTSQRTKVPSTIKAADKNYKSTVLAICDSESDLDTENWKIQHPSHRRLSFDSSTSSITSEFDPDDVVPPKIKGRAIKIKKSVNLGAIKPKSFQEPVRKPIRKSFLASLSKEVPLESADFKAMTYRVKYNTLKEELCKVLYKLFNEKVFDNKLPEDMSIEWSVRLRGTAGKCYNKQSIKHLGKIVRSSRIVLATKILDSPDRLRDTLIHEMCHAATWLVNNVSDGHGSFWKAWANKAIQVFPELPPISRCHDYEIQTKYTYKCTSCGYSIGRHSKSLDLNKKRCGYCHGTFELLINKITKNGKVQKKSTAQTREPSGFALYVKENYQSVKQSGVATKHGEVMKILGQQFSAIKLTPKPEDRLRNNEDESP